MIVDVRQLEGHRGRVSADENVLFEDFIGEEKSIKCHVEVSYQRSGDVYFFDGEVTGVFRTLCHRCLDNVSYDVSGDFDVVVRRGTDRVEPEDPSTAKDYIMLSVNEHEVCLDDFIYESLIVNIPMRILCKEDCRGLCPSCGTNRNESSCACEEPVDRRWGALRKLKNKPTE